MSHEDLTQETPAYAGPSDSNCSTSSTSSTFSEGDMMDMDTPPWTPIWACQNQDFMTSVNRDTTQITPDPSMEHFKQKYVLIHRLGAGDNGETYAAITKGHANRILSLKRLGHPIDLETKDVVVVKFYKPDNLEGDLTNEITFMNESMGDTHNLITHAVDSHHDGAIQWLALPYCNGGTLVSFQKKYPEAITTAFIWHVGLQLMRAACYLHFGTHDLNKMERVHSWPQIYHADIYGCNILLKAGPDPTSGEFPDVVIADFGRAKRWNSQKYSTEELERHQARFLNNQSNDFRCIGRVMSTLRDLAEQGKCECYWPKCDDCVARQAADSSLEVLDLWTDQLMHINTRHRISSMASIMGFLKEFVKAGTAELLRNMHPMPPATSDFFYGCNLRWESAEEALSNFEAHDPQAHQISRFFDVNELSLLTPESQRNVILREIYREVTNTLPGRYILFAEKITKNMTKELDDAALLGLLCDEKDRTAAMDKQLGLLLILKAYQTGGTCDVTSRA
ncbi:hypothetical protein LTR86_003517 [Recurvomyces mirabilis]|nr:hypothetical protein LTR86_003517 [Recurvomyces mirabilis]